MSDNEMKQDTAILNLLKGYAADIDHNDHVDGIDECKESSLEEGVLPTKKCHIGAQGYVSSVEGPDLAKKSEK